MEMNNVKIHRNFLILISDQVHPSDWIHPGSFQHMAISNTTQNKEISYIKRKTPVTVITVNKVGLLV